MRSRLLASLCTLALAAGCAPDTTAPGSRDTSPNASFNSGPSGAGGTVIVYPSTAATNGWAYVTTNNAVGSFVAGPGGQPSGLLPGSLKFETMSLPGGKPQFITNALSGVKLSDLSSLKYSTFISAYATGQHLTHTLNLWIDRDGNPGTTGDSHNLVYEPCYTTSCAGPIQPLNTWSTWDARAVGAIWWSTSVIPGTAFTAAFNSFHPLTTVLAAYPDATVGLVYLQAGQGSGGNPWNGFAGHADGFEYSVNGVTTTFDFEPEPTPPVVTNVTAIPNPAGVGASVALTADISDVATGNSSITGAEYTLDGLNWLAMAAADGAFDEPTEAVTVGLTAPALAGVYDLCVRGTDATGSISASECTSLVVYDPTAGFVTGGGWIQSPSGSASQVTLSAVWDQGFEGDANGWFDGNSNWYGSVTRVPSGTNGVSSYSGGFHAEMTGDASSGPFSRFDAYRSSWNGTWVASVAVYLDPAWSAGSGFDYSVAATGSDGNHQRDFIFHIAKDISTGKLLVAGSNNTNFAIRQDLESLNHHEITTAGWYVLRHTFRDQAGSLAVDLQLLDANGNLLFTETRFTAADLIPAEVGGNRYAWFTVISGITLAVDEHQLEYPILIDPVGKATFGFVSKYVKGKALPTGQTEFTFTAASLKFHSSAYEWLIVNQSGGNAQFKGSGTINGVSGYSFMLWAGDGDKDANALTLDTFRIKIWVTSTNQVVYDNQTDTVIAGGNIMIHVPKK